MADAASYRERTALELMRAGNHYNAVPKHLDAYEAAVRREHAHELAEAVRDRTNPLTPGDCTCEPYCCSCAEIADFIETYGKAP